jgi:glycosyltransferase involved in cell wall biosynthesis
MRLAWLTPLTFGSGVSRFSLSVVNALSSIGVDVDVWHPPSENDLACPWAPTFSLEGVDAAVFDGYDNVIYNLGNHPGSHAAIYDLSRRRRGIVVLHDRVMQDFFFHYATQIRNDPAFYVCLMGHVYGPEAATLAADIVQQGQTVELWEAASTRYPLFEPCLFNAAGVVAHSRETRTLVDRRYPGLLPSVELEHPYYLYNVASEGEPPFSRADLDLPADRVLVVSSGRFGPQKRLDVVMKAISGDPELRTSALFVIAGGGNEDYLAYLRGLARELGAEGVVRFVVEPDDVTMQSLISLADVAVNLRHPSTESASGSLIEQLYFRKPVIVSKVGVYDELPDDVVVKVSLDDEEAQLGSALRSMVLDAASRARVTATATTYAASHFNGSEYARRIAAFAADPRTTGGLLGRVDAAAARLAGVPASDLRTRAADSAGALAAAEAGDS